MLLRERVHEHLRTTTWFQKQIHDEYIARALVDFGYNGTPNN